MRLVPHTRPHHVRGALQHVLDRCRCMAATGNKGAGRGAGAARSGPSRGGRAGGRWVCARSAENSIERPVGVCSIRRRPRGRGCDGHVHHVQPGGAVRAKRGGLLRDRGLLPRPHGGVRQEQALPRAGDHARGPQGRQPAADVGRRAPGGRGPGGPAAAIPKQPPGEVQRATAGAHGPPDEPGLRLGLRRDQAPARAAAARSAVRGPRLRDAYARARARARGPARPGHHHRGLAAPDAAAAPGGRARGAGPRASLRPLGAAQRQQQQQQLRRQRLRGFNVRQFVGGRRGRCHPHPRGRRRGRGVGGARGADQAAACPSVSGGGAGPARRAD